MEKNIENLIKTEDIFNKMILFAKMFNIDIVNYQYEETNNKRQINFYDQDNNYVGSLYIDVEVYNNEILYNLDNFKIELLTDLGKVSGTYSPHTSLLSYILLFNQNDLYNKLAGDLKFNSHNKTFSQVYSGISASIEAYNNDNSLFRVNFNYFDINGIFAIIKNFPHYEKLEFDIWNGIKINYQKNNKRANINVNRGKDNTYEDVAECNFDDKVILVPLKVQTPSVGSSIWQNAGSIDIEPIIESIAIHCKDLEEFIFEAKDLFTIQTLNGKTIYLYDNLANLCFNTTDKRAYLEFATNEGKLTRKR